MTFLLPAAAPLCECFCGHGGRLGTRTLLRSGDGSACVASSPALMLIGAGVSLLFLRLVAPLSHECTSFSTTTTWSLMSEVGWAVAPCFAVVLYFAHDPRPRTA